jgi:hypothetical protein
LWYVGLGLLVFVGLGVMTVWGLGQPGNLSRREVVQLLVLLWMIVAPAGAFIIADCCLSWVEEGADHLRTRNLWQVRTAAMDRVSDVQVTRVGFRLRDADGAVLAEVPFVTAGYEAMLDRMVRLPGVGVERLW